ncbi:hypothetical protein Kpol_1020p17 [Vanderwaltozyma polyspora DSM 70294]|uniref:tRNA pseudouridine(55) synthase n=1 Tax=Vanderwaltozyma polyspora (strain ATCC 22028 / DSM 70294 / BCRC 21397 / CBS 2163 / NBRC 10782 / NRRL Y-8283 / UCD 57-17) TaxID=436907 RepID=A7TLC8_VANPO|nr:uncharacterized protein Kpol_1020p17 [Vanderwaltozyma polyspora DSM 70294]EDO16909.1 hypothetical protein Kpol_1020p17 [Vanderwaltozyma polyspora DSM 70294]
MNGIFAIEKPSGITSNQFMLKLQHALTNSQVFSNEIKRATAERMQQYQQQTGKKASKRKLRKVSKVKMGHGGTLDPLASGVLVIGIGSGTKQLSNYLSGTVKVYESEALFGVSTTSGDVEGDILSRNSTKHLTMDELKTIPDKFKGSLKQTPPIYAALKMDGKPLHEYAREGKPLPRAIEPRQVSIYDLDVFPDSLNTSHNYPLLRPTTEEAIETVKNLNANLLNDTLYFSKEYCEKNKYESEEAKVEKSIDLSEEEEKAISETGDAYRAPLLHFKAKVSSGTYIRSLISDIGKAMRSSCYMVKLIRLQQQDWSLEKYNVFQLNDFTERKEEVWRKVLQLVLEKGADVNVTEELARAEKEYQATNENLAETNNTEDLLPQAEESSSQAKKSDSHNTDTTPQETKGIKRTADEL